MRRPRFILTFLLLSSTLAPSAGAVLPLRDQWRAACAALSSGDAARAHARFVEFVQWYGEESVVREAAFREGLLRLRGLAALQAGSIEEALPLLETWLSEFPEQPRNRAFIRFQLASGYRSLGQIEHTTRHWEAFLDAHPDLPEAALIHWMWADLLISQSRLEEACSHLLAAIENERLPANGRALAKAALAFVECSLGRQIKAFSWLQESRQTGDRTVLDLWRAVLAPSLVSQLMANDHLEAAIEAGQWMDRPARLQEHLSQLLSAVPGKPLNSVRGAIWSRHWHGQVARLESVLASSSNPLDAEAKLYSLRLRSLLKGKRAEEALVLAEALLGSTAPFADAARAAAYSAAIEACQQMKLWHKADRLAAEFQRDYPAHPDLPEILFLMARTNASRKDLPKAIKFGELLIEQYPDHRSQSAWRIATAGWYLQSGKAETALQRFINLEQTAPKPWVPFLRFQQARCLEKFKRMDAARSRFEEVASAEQATAMLREQALASLLKLFMRQHNPEAFARVLARYRSEFADGLNRLMVENLAGSWYAQTGRTEQAIRVFCAVAGEDAPAAVYAHEQLSSLYGNLPDPQALRAHAIGWIRQELARGNPIPAQPFQDLARYQRSAGKPALPQELLKSLLEGLESASAFPTQNLLRVIAAQWEAYRDLLQLDQLSAEDWARQQATACLHEGKLIPYGAFQLFTAQLLEQAGRPDSADAIRIQLLQRIDPALLPGDGLYSVASTAARYDFPGTITLLESFLQRFPQSPNRPDALFALAQLERKRDGPAGISRLDEIIVEWPDAPVFVEASLASATWRLQDNLPGTVEPLLTGLLNRPDLSARTAARALLLRAQADFATGNPERATLNCRRLLALYPDFHDIADDATNLLQANAGAQA